MTEVAIAIVTHNDAADLPSCFAALANLDHRPLELVVVDCASGDESVRIARAQAPSDIPSRVIALNENLGFAGGMNRAIGETEAPFVLSLNADARPNSDFLRRLLGRTTGEGQARVGAVTGRLFRPQESGESPDTRVLDACGMRLTLTWRHLDRGSGELDRGQWAEPERVFGATGAASLFRREALLDAAVDGEIFLSEFHSFREDAELAFRLAERGWDVVYEPWAQGEHRRTNVPERRREMAAHINLDSLKNRYLLRAYHQTFPNLLWTAVPTLARDLGAFLYVLVRERSSLGAYSWLWRHRRSIWQRRRQIRGRRLRRGWEIESWFLRPGKPL